jgi:hypothetical protein
MIKNALMPISLITIVLSTTGAVRAEDTDSLPIWQIERGTKIVVMNDIVFDENTAVLCKDDEGALTECWNPESCWMQSFLTSNDTGESRILRKGTAFYVTGASPIPELSAAIVTTTSTFFGTLGCRSGGELNVGMLRRAFQGLLEIRFSQGALPQR